MQFSLCYDMYKSATNLQRVAKHNCSCYTNVTSQPISEDRKKKKKIREAPKRRVQEDTRVPTFEGDENTRCCQWLVEDGVPHSKAGQGQEGVDRPQTAQLHL